jgi:hypothetical protein
MSTISCYVSSCLSIVRESLFKYSICDLNMTLCHLYYQFIHSLINQLCCKCYLIKYYDVKNLNIWSLWLLYVRKGRIYRILMHTNKSIYFIKDNQWNWLWSIIYSPILSHHEHFQASMYHTMTAVVKMMTLMHVQVFWLC